MFMTAWVEITGYNNLFSKRSNIPLVILPCVNIKDDTNTSSFGITSIFKYLKRFLWEFLY